MLWLGTVDMFQTFQTVFCGAGMAGIGDETYEQLRQILERQNGRSYSLEETKEIGAGLVDFYTMMLKFYKEDAESIKNLSE